MVKKQGKTDSMEVKPIMIKISKENVIYAMSAANAPVATVEPKTQLIFETKDALSDQLQSPNDSFSGFDWGQVNPATGPVYIKGAQPGDILSVTIDKIAINNQGVIVTGTNMGVFGNELQDTSFKIIPIKDGKALFNDKITIPLNKMVGVIGTAPKAGEEISCGTPDYHGGNMDCKEIKEGVTLMLPVNVEGALLALGDLHGAMADGEVCVSGLEVAGHVTVTVDVIKGKELPLPMIFSSEKVMTLASHVDLDVAVDMAVTNMANYLCQHMGMQKNEAAMLLSLAGNTCICQVVDPKKTARVEIKRSVLGTLGIAV